MKTYKIKKSENLKKFEEINAQYKNDLLTKKEFLAKIEKLNNCTSHIREE